MKGFRCDACGWFGPRHHFLIVEWDDAHLGGIMILPEWNCIGCAAWYQGIVRPWK